MPKEGLLTTGEAAEYLRCSVSTVRRLVMKGQIPHFRVGKLVRFRRHDIDVWLTKYRTGDPLSDPKQTPLPHPDQLTLFETGAGE